MWLKNLLNFSRPLSETQIIIKSIKFQCFIRVLLPVSLQQWSVFGLSWTRNSHSASHSCSRMECQENQWWSVGTCWKHKQVLNGFKHRKNAVSYAILTPSKVSPSCRCARLEALGTSPRPRPLVGVSFASPTLKYCVYRLAFMISLFVIFNVIFIPGVQTTFYLVIRICAIS